MVLKWILVLNGSWGQKEAGVERMLVLQAKVPGPDSPNYFCHPV